jgi:hypothetical protein
MRTTLDIDDDILGAAKAVAARENKTAGKVISDLARRGIHAHAARGRSRRVRNGFEVLPADGRVVTPETVQKILEETNEA